MDIRSSVWVEKYRPHTIDECILPKDNKGLFSNYRDKKDFPNLILSGKAGTGKTSVAKALLDEIKADYVVFNGSLNVDKDSLRNEIAAYASSYSVVDDGPTRKFIILDEADYLSTAHVQPALRNFMEEFSDNTGFILTCNHRHRLIPELHSRCSTIDFRIPPSEAPSLALEYHKRLSFILASERIPFDSKVIAAVITRYFPDLRRAINELQAYASSGKIDAGILKSGDTNIRRLVDLLKGKRFTELRKWTAENYDLEAPDLFRMLYEASSDYLEPQSVPALVLILAKYQYQHSFCADPAINILACFVEIMSELTFKG